MFYLKGSKHLYLIGYNHDCNLPIWSNYKELAICSTELRDMFEIQDFIKSQNDVDCQIEWG